MPIEEAVNGRDDMLIDGQNADQAIQSGFNPNFLRLYYAKLFPSGDFFKWLSYGNDGKHPACDKSYFGRREFSFTLENDIYLRFLSFNTASELESGIREKCPFKIDIGPVYSVDPAKRHAYAQGGDNVFKPVERELVFDIDITDYDDVRYCCSGADVCLDCWPLMTAAIKVIDTSLRGSYLITFNQITTCIQSVTRLYPSLVIRFFHYCCEKMRKSLKSEIEIVSIMQMTLVSTIFSGFTVADVVCIVGFLMGKQEGNGFYRVKYAGYH
ncbi:DNA primase small subunit [Linum grandiflorum]